MDMPRIGITEEMFAEARRLEEAVRVHRDQSSLQDSLTGLLGEFAFVQWFTGNWRDHAAALTRGRSDIANRIELKTSAFPMNAHLNLVVREDYASKRRPDAYVQMIIDVPSHDRTVVPGLDCLITGWATHDMVLAQAPRHMSAKTALHTAYRSHLVPIASLRPMADFRFDAEALRSAMVRETLSNAFAMMGRRSRPQSTADGGPSP